MSRPAPGSVLHLLNCRAADGLFSRAVTQSHPPLHELVIDAARGIEWTEALCGQLGLGGGDVAAALPQLRACGADEIVAAQETLLADPRFRGTRGGAMPILDAPTLPADPAATPGVRPAVPLLIGTNADEGTFFFRGGGRRLDPEGAELAAMVARLTHADDPAAAIAATREQLVAAGRPVTANDIICAVVTEAWFAGPVRFATHAGAWRAPVLRSTATASITPHPTGISARCTRSACRCCSAAGARVVSPRGWPVTPPATAAVTQAIDADWARFVHGEPLGVGRRLPRTRRRPSSSWYTAGPPRDARLAGSSSLAYADRWRRPLPDMAAVGPLTAVALK